jgi:hypothetical protein
MVTTRPTRAKRTLGTAAALAVTTYALTHGLDPGALFMAPALLLLIPLLAGRYVGEERLTARAKRRPAIRAPRQLQAARPLATNHSRGSELIARFLAVRPPPPFPA